MTPRAGAAPKSIAGRVGRRIRPFLAALMVCALPVLPSPVFPQAAPEKKPGEPPFSSREPVDPAALARLGVGVSMDRAGGPLGLMVVLSAGEHPDFTAWVLPGVMGTPTQRARIGTVTLLGGAALPAGTLTSLAFLNAGEHFSCWRFLDTDRVTPITVAALAMIRDRTTASGQSKDENEVYWTTVFRAGQTSDLAFRAVARTGWRLRPIEKAPASFRGDVFYLEAKLKSVDRLDIPPAGRDELVSARYQAVLEDSARNAFVIHLTELPRGVRLEKGADVQVSFAGYFFKFVPRPNGPPAPLFIGRTFQPLASIEERLPYATTGLLMSLQAGPAEATAPLTALGLFRTTEHLDYWKLSAAGEVPELRRDLLMQIRDKGFFPMIGDDADLELGELRAYYDFLIVANRKPPDVFAEKARTDVTYAQLTRQPARFRGEIIRREGTLKRLSRHEATRDLQRAGIPYLYEAWVFDKTDTLLPYCVVFTELPEGLRPAEKMGVPVSFDAYFFKRGDFESAAATEGKRRDAPLFVGRTLKVLRVVNPDEGYGETLLKIGMSFVVLTGVAIFGFMVWYRRGDRRVEQRLRALRTTGFVPPPPDAVPMARPVRPVSETPPPNDGNLPSPPYAGERGRG